MKEYESVGWLVMIDAYAALRGRSRRDMAGQGGSPGAAPDCAVLVISAADGVGSQTRGQVRVAGQACAPSVVVFLNKCDLVEDKVVDQRTKEVRALLSEYGYPGADVPVIPGSALKALNGEGKWETGITDLSEALDSYVSDPVSATDLTFLFAVEDVLTLPGRGTVSTG